ncbi:MAG: hypothetical protein AAFV19_09520 [Pseudomonadota bacterium]
MATLPVLAQAQGSVLSDPEPVEQAPAAAAIPEMIPGVNNSDLAFVAVMLVLLGGLIWMWFRGHRMQREADLNASILNRAVSKRSVVLNDEQLAASEQRDKAAENSEVRDMVAGRMGLRSQE